MSNYIKHYLKRLDKVRDILYDLSIKLSEKGFNVKLEKEYTYIIVEDELHALYLQFDEVPYGWSYYKYLEPSIEFGSSKRILTSPYAVVPTVETVTRLLPSCIKPKGYDKRI